LNIFEYVWMLLCKNRLNKISDQFFEYVWMLFYGVELLMNKPYLWVNFWDCS